MPSILTMQPPEKVQPGSHLEPLGISDFRRKLLRYAGMQILVVALSGFLYSWGRSPGLLDVEMIALTFFLIAEIVIIISVFRSRFLLARLFDIYPNSPAANKYLCAAVFLLPLTLFPFLIFLSFKRRVFGKSIPLIFENPKKISMGILMVAICFPIIGFVRATCYANHPKNHFVPLEAFSFYVADPVTYYINSLGDETYSLMQMKDEFESGGSGKKIIEKIRIHVKDRELSSTGMILCLALNVMVRVKDRGPQRNVSSDQNVEVAMGLLGDVTSVLELWNQGKPVAFRNNPLSALNPVEGIEIGLISWVEALVEIKFSDVFMSQMHKLVSSLEKSKETFRHPEMIKASEDLKVRFESLPNYSVMRKQRSSWFWRLIYGSGRVSS